MCAWYAAFYTHKDLVENVTNRGPGVLFLDLECPHHTQQYVACAKDELVQAKEAW